MVFCFKDAIAYLVTNAVSQFSKLATVKLNHQPRRVFDEIEDVTSKRRLPPEVETQGFQFTQFVPELALGIGGVSSKRSRPSYCS